MIWIYSLDLGPLIECDDEHWLSADGKPSFQQPSDVPSKVTFFNVFMQLHHVLAYATRTIVSGSAPYDCLHSFSVV